MFVMSQGKTVSLGLCLYKMFTERNDFLSHLQLESPLPNFQCYVCFGAKKKKKKERNKITFYLQVSFLKVFFKAICVFESLWLSLYISRQSQNSLEIELRRLFPPTLTFTMQLCEETWLSSPFALPQLSQRLTVKGQPLCSLASHLIRVFWIMESRLMSKHCHPFTRTPTSTTSCRYSNG